MIVSWCDQETGESVGSALTRLFRRLKGMTIVMKSFVFSLMPDHQDFDLIRPGLPLMSSELHNGALEVAIDHQNNFEG